MVENIGSMVVVAKADMSSISMALNTVNSAMKDTNRALQQVSGGFSFLGSVIGGVTFGLAAAAVNTVGDMVKGLVELASVSPEVKTAMAGLNKELYDIGVDIGPEAGNLIKSITSLLSTIWDEAGPGLQSITDWLGTSFVPWLEKVVVKTGDIISNLVEMGKELGIGSLTEDTNNLLRDVDLNKTTFGENIAITITSLLDQFGFESASTELSKFTRALINARLNIGGGAGGYAGGSVGGGGGAR